MLVVSQGALLRVTVHAVALHQHFKVHFMRIEFGSIYAGEFALAIDHDAAAATHSGAVDHDRVQADHGPNVLFAGHLGHSPHHRDRSNRQHQVDADTVFNKLAKLVGNETLVGVAAVISGDHDRIAYRAQFLL